MSDRTAWQRIQDEKGVVVEALRHIASLRRFTRLPEGDGQPVRVLPAFSVSDRGTWPLRESRKRRAEREASSSSSDLLQSSYELVPPPVEGPLMNRATI